MVRTLIICCVLFIAASLVNAEKASPGDDHLAAGSTLMMCGPNCLWQIAYMHGQEISLREIGYFVSFKQGMPVSVEDMVAGGRRLGFGPEAMEMDLATLRGYGKPVVALMERKSNKGIGHFVVALPGENSGVQLVDGRCTYRLDDQAFVQAWSGVAICFDGIPRKSSWWIWSVLLGLLLVASTLNFWRKRGWVT